MKTYMAKPEEIERKWYVVDCDGLVLGRVASQIASVLRGKNKPCYTPNVDCGDYVIAINTDKIVLTGKKLEQKYYRYHTGYIGGLKEIQFKKRMSEDSDKALTTAVKGMLPKNSLGRDMIKKLKVFKGAEHNHQAQMPVELKF
ncbi:MAG TPA: 50S ribosomal protein L13 [Clostridia bacterium]|nr:50S ribosomal protein L13 [Clostridia bacterium]